jgi:hypothetical protein
MTTTASRKIATGKLGKLPVRTDVRTLALARYVDRAALPKPPVVLDLTRHVPEWPMYANDTRGDCTIAAAGHMIEAWTAQAHDRPTEISERSVLSAFDHVKVVDPASGEEGAVELDVLTYWRKRGIARHRIGAFARVSLHDHQLVRTAAWLFGGVYIGLSLPLSAQRQLTWDWTGRLSGPDRPGSWGGHAVDVVRYSKGSLTVVTWGRLQDMTWRFWDRYCDEAYCIISPDFLDAGKAPNGFDLEALRADLALVTA